MSLLTGGCDSPVLKELNRFTSPDKVVDVVVATRETDATAASSTELYIVPVGKEPSGTPLLIADNVKDLNPEWVAPKILIISLSSGRIFQYANFWQSKAVDDFRYVVQIYLHDARSPN
jgi:hypothetical protein